MSVINKMLQDLDRRHAMATDTLADLKQVRPVGPEPKGREAFWRVLAVLLVAALGWVGWVAYQLQPRAPVVNELAVKAAQEERKRAAVPVAPVAEAPRPAEAAKPAPEATSAVPPLEAPKLIPDTLRLAEVIESPVPERPASVEPAPRAPAPAAPKQAPAESALRTAAVPAPSKVERRDRTVTGAERAEQEFRRSADLLKKGRGQEAEEGFVAALHVDPSHRAARQALVALNLERGNIEGARRLLHDGLVLNPAQPDFAATLARIQVQRGDLSGANDVLQKAAPAADNYPELHFLRGSVLQRLARHREAADAYRTALNLQNSHPQAWVGLGISLEALEQRKEAAEAFQRALASGPVSPELRAFAEQRVRALR